MINIILNFSLAVSNFVIGKPSFSLDFYFILIKVNYCFDINGRSVHIYLLFYI